MLTSLTSQMHQHYLNCAREAGSDAERVGWKSPQAQRVRFEQLAKILPPENFDLNDFGCGLGDLRNYLVQAGFRNFIYRGFDMLDSMVAQARSAHGTEAGCDFLKISRVEEMSEADFTVASGVFNIRFGLSDGEWQEYIFHTLAQFDARSRKGFAFNALTSYADTERMRPELFYANPLTLFDHCKKKFSKNVALLHDYREYDFTILVRK
jgi:SAM-dependent methyltransferase